MINTTWPQHVLHDASSLYHKRVIVRLDLNLPMQDGVIADTSRLDAVTGFLTKLTFAGAKLVLMSHFGEKGESLKPVADELMRRLPYVHFTETRDIAQLRHDIEELPYGEALLLENVRLWNGETENVPSLARDFASLGDVYINDAFSVSHRNHASVTGIPEHLLSYLGPTCEHELANLSKALTPKLPALLIIGGAKISTKLFLIKRYLDQGVSVFLGGAMVHNILKSRGYEIGTSLYDKDISLPDEFVHHADIILPRDVVLDDGTTVPVDKVPAGRKIVDAGKETLGELNKKITTAQTIIMNGPLGLYEEGWMHGTEYVLTSLGHADATTYIGGGDTVTAANKVHALKGISFVSLGGGAMLEYLSSGTLPGIDAVTQSI